MLNPHHLSDERAFPFRLYGKPVPIDHPKYNEYSTAIAKFPSVLSCISSASEDIDKIDLFAFSWSRIESLEDADVCVYRVIDSLGDIDISRQWFLKQGFSVSEVRTIPASVMRLRGATREGLAYTATHLPTTLSDIYKSNFFLSTLNTAPIHNISVAVEFYNDTTLDTVHFTVTLE